MRQAVFEGANKRSQARWVIDEYAKISWAAVCDSPPSLPMLAEAVLAMTNLGVWGLWISVARPGIFWIVSRAVRGAQARFLETLINHE